MPPIAIDFEASCLPRHGRSFPIEVGIADGYYSRSWLIRPTSEWVDWDWTQQAEALHGITREQLAAQGQPAAVVMAELSAAVAGYRVVADSRLDQDWLDLLAAAAGTLAPFRVDHIASVVDDLSVTQPQIDEAVAYADRRQPERHRAAADAEWLASVLWKLRQEAHLDAYAYAA